MSSNTFESIMSEHNDERLIDVLKNRNNYQENTVQAAINEGIKRNIIKDIEDLEKKYPIITPIPDFVQKDIRFFNKKIDFRKTTHVLYLIGVGSIVSIVFLLKSIPYLPIIYLLLVFYCSKNYNHTLANVIIWFAAFQIVAIFLFIISIFMQMFL